MEEGQKEEPVTLYLRVLHPPHDLRPTYFWAEIPHDSDEVKEEVELEINPIFRDPRTYTYGSALAAVGSRLFVIGGGSRCGDPDFHRAVDFIDSAPPPTIRRWGRLPHLPIFLNKIYAFAINDDLYVIGASTPGRLAFLVYDGCQSQWSQVPVKNGGSSFRLADTKFICSHIVVYKEDNPTQPKQVLFHGPRGSSGYSVYMNYYNFDNQHWGFCNFPVPGTACPGAIMVHDGDGMEYYYFIEEGCRQLRAYCVTNSCFLSDPVDALGDVGFSKMSHSANNIVHLGKGLLCVAWVEGDFGSQVVSFVKFTVTIKGGDRVGRKAYATVKAQGKWKVPGLVHSTSFLLPVAKDGETHCSTVSSNSQRADDQNVEIDDVYDELHTPNTQEGHRQTLEKRPTSSTRKYVAKDKRNKKRKMIPDGMSRGLAASSVGLGIGQVTIEEAFAILVRMTHPIVAPGSDLYCVALHTFTFSSLRKIFSLIPTDEARIEWLKKQKTMLVKKEIWDSK